MQKAISFKNESKFLKTLRDRVKEKLNGNQTGNYKLFIKTAIIILAAVVLYFLPYFVKLSITSYVLVAGLRGLVMGFAGFNIGHDAIHGSYSKSDRFNEIMGLSFDASGVSSYYWKYKHNIMHHTDTNTEDDNDIETNEVLRLAPWQRWHWIHRFQFIYAFILYGFLHLQWVFYNDTHKYLTNKIGRKEIPPMNKNQFIIFISGKILYVTKSLILPIVILGFWQGVISFFVMEFVCGFTISVVFQLAHVQNKSQFTGTSKEWAFHQLQTTADFATYNPIIRCTLGGLNFQAMHHLLPKVSHIHYPKLQKLFIETCNEFKIGYKHYKTMFGATLDHISYLYKMGKKPPIMYCV